MNLHFSLYAKHTDAIVIESCLFVLNFKKYAQITSREQIAGANLCVYFDKYYATYS